MHEPRLLWPSCQALALPKFRIGICIFRRGGAVRAIVLFYGLCRGWSSRRAPGRIIAVNACWYVFFFVLHEGRVEVERGGCLALRELGAVEKYCCGGLGCWCARGCDLSGLQICVIRPEGRRLSDVIGGCLSFEHIQRILILPKWGWDVIAVWL